MAEYLKMRCCICPNIEHPEKAVCPPSPTEKNETECRFVKRYIDSRGWKYRVMGGLGESTYKARYQKPGKIGWRCMSQLEWQHTFDEAQKDLNDYAQRKGWTELTGEISEY